MVSLYQPGLYQAVRYARNVEVESENGARKFQPLIGEEAGFLTTLAGFGLARRGVTIYAFSGTGKTVMADAVWSLLPDGHKLTVDMLTDKAIWYMAPKLNAATFLYFPEEQNASDASEVVKVKKKLGEGKAAEREVTTRDQTGRMKTERYRIEWHPDLSTMAVGNKVGEQVFDEEQERRRIMVTTDPTSAQTKRVLKAQGGVWARGVQACRDMTADEIAALKWHVAECVAAYDDVKEVRFPGAEAFAEQVPAVFTSARSAFPLLQHVARGVALWYHKTERVQDGVLYLSPARFAETLDFYGDVFFANAMRLPPLGKELLQSLPRPEWDDSHGVVAVGSMLTEAEIGDRMKERGYALEKRKVAAILSRLLIAGFVEENTDLEKKRYHRTGLSDMRQVVDWSEILDATRDVARATMPDAESWIETHASGDAINYVSPLTGKPAILKGASK